MNLIFISFEAAYGIPEYISIIKTRWINPSNGVWRVLIEICTSRQPNRILAYESPYFRIIVAESVVIKSCHTK